MINENELRIGNWVLNVDNEQVVVNEIRDEFYLGNGRGLYYHTSSGIPLTPEILQACGFKHRGSIYWDIEISDINFQVKLYDDGGYRLTMKRQMVNSINVLGIYKHLHTLQNIIHALTQTELLIKL